MKLQAARAEDTRFHYLRLLMLIGALAAGAVMMALYVQLLHEAVAKSARTATVAPAAVVAARPVTSTDE